VCCIVLQRVGSVLQCVAHTNTHTKRDKEVRQIQAVCRVSDSLIYSTSLKFEVCVGCQIV